MTKILIVDVHAEMYRDALREKFPALQFQLFHNKSEVTGNLGDIDVMMMFGIEVRDFMLAGAPNLKWIQSLATGVDHFLRCPSLKPNVLITSGRGIHGPPMREQVVYMMMAISRDAVRAVGDQKAHFWERRLWSTLHGKTAVIAGTGVVGGAIGELLKALGMHVIGVTREPRAAAGFDEMIATDRLADAARRADYLINMLPASENNIGIFDAGIFAAMKPSAYYISAGRGGAARGVARAPHRRRRARSIPDRAAAGRQLVLGPAERVHHAAHRRLRDRIRGFHHAADRRQYAAVFGRPAGRDAQYRLALSALGRALGMA
jgi:phosphoglycerate dehydrogenase-like enzyme